MCLNMVVYMFTLLEVWWASWVCRLMSFRKCWTFGLLFSGIPFIHTVWAFPTCFLCNMFYIHFSPFVLVWVYFIGYIYFLYILYSSPFILFVYCDQSIAKPNPSGFNIRYCNFFQFYSVHLIFYSINSILDYILILSSISSFSNFLLNIYHNYFKVIAC